jgi:RNA polymerase sigma-70 factor (ECF subfamily)
VTLEVQEAEAIEAFLSRPDEDSCRAVFRAMSPRVFRYLRLHGCERGVAEDLTQEVMLAVFRQGAQLRQRELFRPWLFRIARNAWLQHLRHEKRRIQAVGMEQATETAVQPDPVRGADFRRWLEALEAADRDLVLLRYVEGLQYHEIASMLNTPIGTVQWKIFELKRKLAAYAGRHPRPGVA